MQTGQKKQKNGLQGGTLKRRIDAKITATFFQIYQLFLALKRKNRAVKNVKIASIFSEKTIEVDGKPTGECLAALARTYAQTNGHSVNILPSAPSTG